MIIQCEQCRTRFRLDDSKIKESGVKVRCAKCRHVFMVTKQQPEEPVDTLTTQPPGTAEGEAVPPWSAPESPAESPFAAALAQEQQEHSVESNAFEAPKEEQSQVPAGDFSFAANQESAPFDAEAPPAPREEFDFGEVDFSPPTEQPALAQEADTPVQARQEPSPFGDEFDFRETDSGQQPVPEEEEQAPAAPREEFDFGEVDFGSPTEQPTIAQEADTPVQARQEPSPFGDEFDFKEPDGGQQPAPEEHREPAAPHGEIDFGDVNLEPPNEPRPEAPIGAEPFPPRQEDNAAQAAPPLEFEFGLPDSANAPQSRTSAENSETAPTGTDKAAIADAFDFAMELPTPPSGQAPPTEKETFSFDTPVQPAAPATPAGIAEPAPPAEAAPRKQAAASPVSKPETADAVPTTAPEDELPPLSIPSRRKSSSLTKALLGLLLLVIVGAAAFYGKELFPKLKRMIVPESGSIQLRSVTSSFIRNTATGSELLVIRGEAVNGFSTPRASLRVKGMVYGDKDQVLVSKNAYCGNPLSPQQLSSMPLDAIELAMANQVGSGLSNLEVAPGKALPFTIVIATLPEGARNIGVTPAGSQALGDKPR